MKITKRVLFVLSVAVLGACAVYYWQHGTSAHAGEFRDYNPAEHKAFILQEFKNNWRWLVETPDYDVVFTFDTHSPSKHEAKYFGTMNIKILYQEGKPVGFITYYMRTDSEGDILFVEVNEAFRGRKLAEKMVRYALDEMKKMGATTVKMLTYTGNVKAQKVYERIGFKEMYHDEGHIFYKYTY